ncbi:hypothetical protein AC579_4277 [Pseudocercospora musae]|uniref:Uncharacterized protein n=1 Tax=Pseudocercospora musae TaxID=113226 RepID=A0A139IB16_9PEZI|nr:hypothetical protein AC579_4277 [Pseudocercospora musae]
MHEDWDENFTEAFVSDGLLTGEWYQVSDSYVPGRHRFERCTNSSEALKLDVAAFWYHHLAAKQIFPRVRSNIWTQRPGMHPVRSDHCFQSPRCSNPDQCGQVSPARATNLFLVVGSMWTPVISHMRNESPSS